ASGLFTIRSPISNHETLNLRRVTHAAQGIAHINPFIHLIPASMRSTINAAGWTMHLGDTCMTKTAFAESVRSAATELQAATSTIIRKYDALDPRSKNALRLRVAITRLRLEISHLREADWRDDGETYGLIEDILSAVFDIGRSFRALDTEY